MGQLDVLTQVGCSTIVRPWLVLDRSQLASRCWIFQKRNYNGPIFQSKLMRWQWLPWAPAQSRLSPGHSRALREHSWVVTREV